MIKDNELKEIAEKVLNDSTLRFGVRTLDDDESYEVGDKARESFAWDFEADSSVYDLDNNTESAGYTCATGVDESQDTDGYADVEEDVQNLVEAMKVAINYNAKSYNPAKNSKMVIILGQENWEFETDDFEINLEDAEVAAVFEMED
jgi:hypothetical protein